VPTLKLRFPGGRYHATPWGHHVNEGLVEWPPCPWRLLRALIACGFSSQGWTEVPPLMRQLINKLSAVLPRYALPRATVAHTRHYMPYVEGAKQKTTLIFDTWADVGDGELLVYWPCELNAEETTLLRDIVSSLGYLGRSESWVEANLISADAALADALTVAPCADSQQRGPGYEQISLLAPMLPDEYARWREEQVRSVREASAASHGTKKPTARQRKALAQALAPYPEDLLACLTKDTAWWKGHGWSQPPGSRRVLYWRRRDALEVTLPPGMHPRSSLPVTTMLLAITTPSGSKSALPPVTRTLPQAELFHRAVVGRVGKGHPVNCPELTGKDALGGILQHGHRHAHTLPVDLDGDGHLDHIIIYAPMGLGAEAQRAIRTLRRTWTKGGVGELQLAVVGAGNLDMLRRLPGSLGEAVGQLLGPPGGARVWESVTPFVPPRFLKQRGKNTLIGQVNAELASRGRPAAECVSVDAPLTRELRHHVRRRIRGGPSPAADIGYGLRLIFSEPLHGPLMLGHASHFGLGLFRFCPGYE
jgi:CRISPR-associated protein Csb2